MSNLANVRVILNFNNSVLLTRNPTNNLPLKNCLFGSVKLVRNTIKSRFTYNGRGIAFCGEGSWSFSTGFC